MASAFLMSFRLLPSNMMMMNNAQLMKRSVVVPIIRCSAEKGSSSDGPNPNPNPSISSDELKSSSSAEKALKTTTMGATAPTVTPSKVSFQTIMAFNGAGPETINGRLAMLGFVWALAREFATHERVAEQLSSGRYPILAIMLLFSSASLIPLLSGKNPNNLNFGPFNAQAELLNGRIAMIGFSGLILTEAIQGIPLIH